MAEVRQCPKCQQPAAVLVMAWGAGFLISAKEPLWRWGAGLVMGALAVFMFGQNARRLFNRSKHKVIEEHVL